MAQDTSWRGPPGQASSSILDLMRLTKSKQSSGSIRSVAATPVDLARILRVRTPIVRARYEYEDTTEPRLADLVAHWLASRR
jgi:hypothetical protein